VDWSPLLDSVRAAASQRMRDSSRQPDLEFTPLEVCTGRSRVYANHSAYILLASNMFSLTLIAHYNVEGIRPLVGSALGMSANDASPFLAMDFVKEFCNLTAGSLARSLRETGINLGISLPVGLRGYSKIFTPEAPHNIAGQCTAMCKLTSPEEALYLEVVAHCSSNDVLELLGNLSTPQPEQPEEIEFL